MNQLTDKKITPEDLVALVVCKGHDYFGQLGKVELNQNADHEPDSLKIIFRDGKTDSIDPKLKTEFGWAPIEFFYRHRDDLGRALDQRGEGPLGLIETFQRKSCGDLSDLIKQYQELFNWKL